MPRAGLARISHQGHGLRGAFRPKEQERRAARCGASGKRRDALFRSEGAADPDAVAKTDGWSGYVSVPPDRHEVHVVGKTAAHLVLPWIHQIFSNLKGWARGVYHGLRRKHLQAYLDEFVFRFNRRKTRHAAFRSLFGLALNANPLTYKMLRKPEPCA